MKRLTALFLALTLCFGFGAVTASAEVLEDGTLLGDVNFDGMVDSLDAALVLKYDAWLLDFELDALIAGDVNWDGIVDSLDAAQILRFDAGLIEDVGITPIYDYDEELMYAWSVETDEGKMTFDFFDLGYGEVYFDGVYVADLYWYIHGGLYMEIVDYETGESEVMVENADYFIDEEDKLSITYEGETVVLVKDEELFEYPDTSFVVPDNAEYDSAVVGAWVYYEDGTAMIFTFNADGEGSVKMDGITIDVIWYTLDGKISVGMSLFGLTDTLFEDLDYVAEEDSITLDDGFEIIVLTSYDAALENGNSQAPDEDHDSALVGTWAVESAGLELTVVFEADGTGTASAEGVTFGVNWSTNDGLISAELVYGGEVQPFYDDNVYTVDGDTFTVTFSDGADVYTKIA